MSRSTQTADTRPCKLRFVNNSPAPVDIFWVTYEGTHQKYAGVPPYSQHPQDTFTTHPWLVRSSATDKILGQYVGNTAVIELLPDSGFKVHLGTAKNVCPKPRPTPAHWGQYQQRAVVRGISIRAFDCVPEDAVLAATYALTCMLAYTPAAICKRLAENEADIAIIGRDQVTSDIPPHNHLCGQECATGNRTFDNGTRGVGGNLSCPTCSVGEENLTMLNDKYYSQENILIHEFAHSVMCIGMDDEQRQSIGKAYQEAKQGGLYQSNIYMMENADEYWAEATQSWFDATVRTDVNDGHNTREKIQAHDPLLSILLMHAYGNAPWRYTHTMPRRWGGKPRSTPMLHPNLHLTQQEDDVQLHHAQPIKSLNTSTFAAVDSTSGHQARKSRRICCFPLASFWQTTDSKNHRA